MSYCIRAVASPAQAHTGTFPRALRLCLTGPAPFDICLDLVSEETLSYSPTDFHVAFIDRLVSLRLIASGFIHLMFNYKQAVSKQPTC